MVCGLRAAAAAAAAAFLVVVEHERWTAPHTMSDAREITLREKHVALGELKSCKSTRAVRHRHHARPRPRQPSRRAN